MRYEARAMKWSCALIFVALLAGCGGSLSTRLTQTGERLRFPAKPVNCPLHILRATQPIPAHVPLAELSYSDGGGLTADGKGVVEGELRAESCRLGAEGYIIREERYGIPFVGTEVEATAFVWARYYPVVPAMPVPAPAAPSAPTPAPEQP
jgi:hypothetical protein